MPEDQTTTRLISLDVFRGMTIGGMVLVNNPGTSPVYWPLDHAEWNGLTPTDWIFPFFLFIVGMSISIALGKRVEERVDRAIYTKIFSRAALIYLLGQLMSILPFFEYGKTEAPTLVRPAIWLLLSASLLFFLLRKFRVAIAIAAIGVFGILFLYLAGYHVAPYNFGTMRVLGVLPRIAICYLAASLIFLNTTWKQQTCIALALLIGYWIVMATISVPGCAVTSNDDKACNLAAYVDRMVIGVNHIWRYGKVYDPEGIMSTIPAIATTLSGVLAGTWMRTRRDNLDKLSGIFVFGIALFAIGWIWNSFFPFNKALWTSSYVFVTSGLALATFGVCYWLLDIKGYKRWATPFKIFGANALALFVFSGLMARMLGAFKFDGPWPEPKTFGSLLLDNVLLRIMQPTNASLTYAIGFILVWLFLMWLLYRRNIYIKV